MIRLNGWSILALTSCLILSDPFGLSRSETAGEEKPTGKRLLVVAPGAFHRELQPFNRAGRTIS